MPGQRRRVFGPLFYSTLILAILVIAYTGILNTLVGDYWRAVRDRWEIKKLAVGIRDKNPVIRESSMRRLVTKGSEIALPYVLLQARSRATGQPIHSLAAMARVATRW